MNNQQFRRLVLDKPATQQNGSPSLPNARPAALGSRRALAVGSIAPRSVKTPSTAFDYARERARKKQNPADKPSVPRLNDPTPDTTNDAKPDDDKAGRIAALEQRLKAGALDRAEFEKQRDKITAGDISATHLVKGLDRQLLARIRQGEDVMSSATTPPADEADVETELDALQGEAVAPVQHEQASKKGELAPRPPKTGVKRSRDDIIAELKAQRQAAAAARTAARPDLGDKFRDISQTTTLQKRIVDHKGREVMIVRDEHGNVKKKVRKAVVAVVEDKPRLLDDLVAPAVQPPREQSQEKQSDAPPVAEPSDAVDSDDDIFQGAGTAYDPLADEQEAPTEKPPKPTNYFATTTTTFAEPAPPQNPLSDPTVLAAVKRASTLAEFKMKLDDSVEESGEQERLRKKAAMLAASDRDLDDMDLGFGSSRFQDGEDDDIKLSAWTGDGDESVAVGSKGPKKRVRKRKGDKNSVKDVMEVLERRKADS